MNDGRSLHYAANAGSMFNPLIITIFQDATSWFSCAGPFNRIAEVDIAAEPGRCFPMENEKHKAEAWRRRASNLREAARLAQDPVEQQTLSALAEDCDEIASNEEQVTAKAADAQD